MRTHPIQRRGIAALVHGRGDALGSEVFPGENAGNLAVDRTVAREQKGRLPERTTEANGLIGASLALSRGQL